MSKTESVISRHLGGPLSVLIVSLAFLVVGTVVSGCGGSKSKPSTEVASAANAPENLPAPAPNTPAYAVREVANGGTIAGQITFLGRPMPPRLVAVNQDVSVCGSQRKIYPVKVDDGGIVDAVVWIDDIHEGKAYNFPSAVLDQKKCSYNPHIVLMQPGDLKVTTSDPVPHNVHSYSESNRTYNESMNPLNREVTLHLARPERITFKCDLHGWMEAFIVVASNPYYAVTQRAGSFRLQDVPPGIYHVKTWQETLGELDHTVTVEAGKTVTVNFQFNSTNSERAEVR
ncbi:MAG: hypothetical protein WA876_08815 [Candidatus Acidiferrales bacterium]